LDEGLEEPDDGKELK